MKIHHSVDSFEQVKGAVVTIGTFDGVHHGHRQLFDRLKGIAGEIQGSVVVLTFYPHPRSVLQDQGDPVKLLSSQREKISLLEKAGVDHLIIQAFDEQFAMIEAKDFIEEIICKKLKTSVLVVGYDHRFGKNRSGSFSDLELASAAKGFRLEQISEQMIDQITVSSTKIRKALISGDLEAANGLLGYHYSLAGTVIHGQKLGRKLGFPTANIQPESEDKLIPAEGVYVVSCAVKGLSLHGLLSIGRRPTVNDSGKLSVEVYLLDFNDDIYGEFMEVTLLKRLRGDQKFGSLDLLVEQMNRDLAEARIFLAKQ